MLTRRNFLATTAAASVPVSASSAEAQRALTPVPQQENPVLLEAYQRFLAARSELAAAKEALDWLADEWRHLWPLAPVELLWTANAQDQFTSRAKAECDIAGRYLMRSSNDFPTRRPAKHPTMTCYSLVTSEYAEEMLDYSRRRVPAGRTTKSLARNTAMRDEAVQTWKQRAQLARQYEMETARLSAESGVEKVKHRVAAARSALAAACSDISRAEVRTMDGLRIKCEALKVNGVPQAVVMQDTILGEMARFIDATLAVVARTPA